MENRPNYIARLTGSDYDKDGMPISVDIEDQGCGGIQVVCDGEDSPTVRVCGEVNITDVAAMMYVLIDTWGEEPLRLAFEAAAKVYKYEEAGDDGDADKAEEHPGSAEVCGVHGAEAGLREEL